MAAINTDLNAYERIIVKIGSALLVDPKTGNINQSWLEGLANDIAHFVRAGKQIVIVSSGAIALGRERLNLQDSPLTLAQKQACAAVGQAQLTQAYESVLRPLNLIAAQALLTINDTEDRSRWINAKETLNTLLGLGAVPIINENDTVATDEIRYGDNDRLAARVAQMISADCLVLLSDIDGLYDKDPNENTDAKHIALIPDISPEITAMAGGANTRRGTGSGGMSTKIWAAKIATSGGCAVVITKGERPNPLSALMEKQTRASWFKPRTSPMLARKQWIANSLQPKGSISIDAGAAAALQDGKSLLSAGVTDVNGNFAKGDPVLIKNPKGIVIAKGLIAYSMQDTIRIKGLKSSAIMGVLGYQGSTSLVHRDNLTLNKE